LYIRHVALLPLAEVSQLEQTRRIQFIALILTCLKRMCSNKLHICAAINLILVQQEISYLCSKKLKVCAARNFMCAATNFVFVQQEIKHH
jgi:hypothetical protein